MKEVVLVVGETQERADDFVNLLIDFYYKADIESIRWLGPHRTKLSDETIIYAISAASIYKIRGYRTTKVFIDPCIPEDAEARSLAMCTISKAISF